MTQSVCNNHLDKLEFLLMYKVQDFHKAGYVDITLDVLQKYLMYSKWKNRQLFLHEMAADVKNLTHVEVMDYLRLENIFHAKEETLHKIFHNLL